MYFAHSKRIYNTPLEKEILRYLREELGMEILCPNTDIGELRSMTPYLKRVAKCDGVIVHEYRECVGRGCYEEVSTALQLNKPVYAIRGVELISVKGIIIYDSTDWKIGYGKLIVNKKESKDEFKAIQTKTSQT